ncbi:MAG: TolC family protein [Vulcanimicrobiaceae bacterium]
MHLGLLGSLMVLGQLTPLGGATPVPSVTGAPVSAIVAPPVPAVAPTFSTGSNQPLPTAEIVGVSAQPFVGISLDDAIAMALARNGDLAISQLNRRIAGYRVVAANGAYDVNFQIAPTFSYAKSASVSAFQSGPGGGPITQTSAGANASLSGITKRGGSYSIGLSGSRIDNNATVNSYDPYYSTTFNVTFTQPLGRGARTDANRQRIELAKIGADQSDASALTTASGTISSVANAYYDLIAAWRSVSIQEDALRQAKAQSESNARLVRAGQAAPADVVESNAQVQVFQDNVYAALQNVALLQNRLKSLILADAQDPIWQSNLVPTTLETQLPQPPKLPELVLDAIRNRPEIAVLRDEQRSAGVELAAAADETRPKIDVQFGFSEAGFAGQLTNPAINPIAGIFGAQTTAINQLIAAANVNLPPAQQIAPINGAFPLPPPNTVGNLGNSIGSLLDGRYPAYTAQVIVGLPLGNRTAKADVAIARAQAQTLQVQEVGLIQQLTVEARNALQSYQSARARLVAAQAARQAAEQVEASEERKFHAGESTTYLVLQRQVALAGDRGLELQAQTDLEKAIVELERAQGQLLTHYGVDAAALGVKTAGPVP